MNLCDKENVKNLFKKYNISPSKRLGQNFLVDKRTLKKFVEAINLQPNDIVLEIGPGLGILLHSGWLGWLSREASLLRSVLRLNRCMEGACRRVHQHPNQRLHN